MQIEGVLHGKSNFRVPGSLAASRHFARSAPRHGPFRSDGSLDPAVAGSSLRFGRVRYSGCGKRYLFRGQLCLGDQLFPADRCCPAGPDCQSRQPQDQHLWQWSERDHRRKSGGLRHDQRQWKQYFHQQRRRSRRLRKFDPRRCLDNDWRCRNGRPRINWRVRAQRLWQRVDYGRQGFDGQRQVGGRGCDQRAWQCCGRCHNGRDAGVWLHGHSDCCQ